MSRRHFRLVALALVALAPGTARATELFPDTIATALGVSASPPCSICHATALGQKGNVIQPFGRRAVAYGLVPNDDANLKVILEKMRAARDDSDEDGVSDIDELKNGTNPNINDVTGLPPDNGVQPQFGCQASRASGGAAAHSRVLPFAGAALLGMMLLRWRRLAPRLVGVSPKHRRRRPDVAR